MSRFSSERAGRVGLLSQATVEEGGGGEEKEGEYQIRMGGLEKSMGLRKF